MVKLLRHEYAPRRALRLEMDECGQWSQCGNAYGGDPSLGRRGGVCLYALLILSVSVVA